MTNTLLTVSFKLPARDLRRIPDKNRSQFLRAAVQEKLARRADDNWSPKTAIGKKLARLRASHVAGGARMLSPEEISDEIRQRRGGLA